MAVHAPRQRRSSFGHQLWRIAEGPLIGLVLGALLARYGANEKTHFHYFRQQESGRAKSQANNKTDSLNLLEELERRDPRLATEPAIREVTWFGLPIATEYAGLDARAAYAGAPWYHLPSHWSPRLQVLFGLFGGLIGWLIAQQRSLGKLQRQLKRLEQTPPTASVSQTGENSVLPA